MVREKAEREEKSQVRGERQPKMRGGGIGPERESMEGLALN